MAKVRTVNASAEAQSSRLERHTDHICQSPWPNCWRCGASLGCRQCAASVNTQVFCRGCLVWGTPEALLEHGPIVPDERHHHSHQPPSLSAYPPAWISAYRRSESEVLEILSAEGQGLGSAGAEVARHMMDALSAAMSLRYAEPIMKAWEQRGDTIGVPEEKAAA